MGKNSLQNSTYILRVETFRKTPTGICQSLADWKGEKIGGIVSSLHKTMAGGRHLQKSQWDGSLMKGTSTAAGQTTDVSGSKR